VVVNDFRGYTIVGAGAIGGTLAWSLATHGHPVSVVDADPVHRAAISERGVILERGGRRVASPVGAVFSLDDCPQGLARVLLAVKAHATPAAAEWLAEHLAPDGLVVSMQNGLNEPVLAAVLGHERVVGAFVNLFADVVEPGVIRDGGVGAVAIGEVDGSVTTRVEEIVADLQAWGAVVATHNVLGFLWSKLGLGAMLAATALADDSMADLLDRHRPAMHRLVAEVMAVAGGLGVQSEAFDAFNPQAYSLASDTSAAEAATDALVAWLHTQPKQRSGIWRDIAVRHRPTEVPVQFAPVIAAADTLELPTPVLRTMLDQLAEVERKPQSMSENRLSFLDSVAGRSRHE
jgi:2-dehydropantoate 2-reductase